MCFQNILLATDGSETAKHAARRVAEIQEKFNSKVVVYHAEKHYYSSSSTGYTQPRAFPFFDLGFVSHDKNVKNELEMQDIFRDWGKRMLDETVEIFTEKGLEVESRLIEQMKPGDYASYITEKEDFDLIVVGCKGQHSKLKDLLIGSVANKIMKVAKCDVLIVR